MLRTHPPGMCGQKKAWEMLALKRMANMSNTSPTKGRTTSQVGSGAGALKPTLTAPNEDKDHAHAKRVDVGLLKATDKVLIPVNWAGGFLFRHEPGRQTDRPVPVTPAQGLPVPFPRDARRQAKPSQDAPSQKNKVRMIS